MTYVHDRAWRISRVSPHATFDERSALRDLEYPRNAHRMTPEESIAIGAQLDQRLEALEAKYADELAAAQLEQRRERVRCFGFPITSDDEESLARRTLKPTRSRKVADAFRSGSKSLLILTGSTGVGKTIAACELLVQYGGSYIRATKLARLFLAQFGSEVDERDELIDGAGLVVVDDIGVERGDSMQLALTEMIDRRRTHDRRTIWITNLSKADFEARYPDKRLHSRLAQAAVWSVDAGDDLRRSSP